MDPEERPEDILLFAYVDGELDEEQRRLVEDLLARDPDACQRVAQIREGLSSDWGSDRDQGMTSRVFWLAEDQGWGGFCAWWKPGSMERAAVLT